MFMEEQAEENSEEEEESIDGEIGNEYKNRNELKRLQEDMDRRHGHKKRAPQFMEFENEEQFKEYYGDEGEQNDMEVEESEGEGKSANLPKMDDPKLFAVRCKTGFEKESVFCIMNKFMSYLGRGEDLQIYSANYIEKFPGFIYVESHKEAHVREAIKDLFGMSFNRGAKIEIIPIKEVPQVFTEDQSQNREVQLL